MRSWFFDDVAGAAATVSHRADPIDTTDSLAYTFSAVDLGADAASHKVVVCAAGSNGGFAVLSITIGGNAASLVKAQVANNNTTEIWQANGITATSGDIIVTWTGIQDRCGIGVDAVYGAADAVHDTAGASNVNPLEDAAGLDIPAGGVAIAASFNQNTTTSTWTNLTETYDEIVEGAFAHSGANGAFATAQTALAVKCQLAAPGLSLEGFAAASWGPA